MKGTGNIIIEVLDVKCTEFRMFYNSHWDIEIRTKAGIKKVSLLYDDTENVGVMKDLLHKCVTVGDILSHDETGLIYYD